MNILKLSLNSPKNTFFNSTGLLSFPFSLWYIFFLLQYGILLSDTLLTFHSRFYQFELNHNIFFTVDATFKDMCILLRGRKLV